MNILASIPSPEQASFNIGPLSIYYYAICIMIGMVVAAIVTDRRMVARGVERGTVLDFAIWTIVLGIIGARIFHVLTHINDYIGRSFWAVFDLREGGIAIFGALIGGAIGAAIASRITGVRFWTFADALAPGLLIAQAFGRVGNWFNQELFGQPTTLPWGLEIEPSNPAYPIGLPDGVLFHPTFLYEALWNLLGAALIIVVTSKIRLQWGRTFALYLIWYGAGRIVWETIRIDPSIVVLGLRINVWAAVVAIVLGIAIFFVQQRRHPGLARSPYLPGKSPADRIERENEDDGVEYVDTSAPDDARTLEGESTNATPVDPPSEENAAPPSAHAAPGLNPQS